MGLIASYFAADSRAAEALPLGPERLAELQAVDGPALLPTDLGDLERRMRGRESWTMVDQTTETWLIRLGDRFVAQLAALPDPIDETLIDAWQLSSDELDALELMRPLARAASMEPGQALYIWLGL
jgi:hypothetical protein